MMVRREFLQSTALLLAGHAVGLSPSLDREALWYHLHCRCCGYRFSEEKPSEVKPRDKSGKPIMGPCVICAEYFPGYVMAVPADWTP